MKEIEDLRVRIGSDYYQTGGQERIVIYFAMHPEYDPATNNYDCSVLRVDPPFDKKGFQYRVSNNNNYQPPKLRYAFVLKYLTTKQNAV